MKVLLEVAVVKRKGLEVLARPVGGSYSTYLVSTEIVRKLSAYDLPCVVAAKVDGSCILSVTWTGTPAAAIKEALTPVSPCSKSKLSGITPQEFAELIGSDILGYYL